MVKKGQQTLQPVEKKKKPPIDPKKAAFNKRKKELHSLYKKYKVGLVSQEDLTDEQRFLLSKYYGVNG